VRDAANRRLRDELGITACELVAAGEFMYRAELGDGLVEHELDHVLIGRWSGNVAPNPAEVADVRWVGRGHLLRSMAKSPERYSVWALDVVFRACSYRWRLDPERPRTERGDDPFRVDRARFTG
jgi:isopentenyldiphosphate isomerase